MHKNLHYKQWIVIPFFALRFSPVRFCVLIRCNREPKVDRSFYRGKINIAPASCEQARNRRLFPKTIQLRNDWHIHAHTWQLLTRVRGAIVYRHDEAVNENVTNVFTRSTCATCYSVSAFLSFLRKINSRILSVIKCPFIFAYIYTETQFISQMENFIWHYISRT